MSDFARIINWCDWILLGGVLFIGLRGLLEMLAETRHSQRAPRGPLADPLHWEHASLFWVFSNHVFPVALGIVLATLAVRF